MIFDLAAIDVGFDLHRLADAQVAQFRFLEIGIDPQLVKRHDGQQRRTRHDMGADLHAALGHVARRRCQDGIAPRRHPGSEEIGLGRLHAWVVDDVDAGNAGTRGLELRLRHRKRRLGLGRRLARVRYFFGRQRMVVRQRRAARQVVFGLLQHQLALFDRRLVLRHVGIALAQLAHRGAEFGFGLAQIQFGVERIELDHFSAGLDHLRLVGADFLHVARHLRGQRDHVAADIGVVGGFALRQHGRVIHAVGDAGYDEQRRHADQHGAAFSALTFGGSLGLAFSGHGHSLLLLFEALSTSVCGTV